MLDKYNPTHILFLDIETVPRKPAFEELSVEEQALWERKSSHFRNDEQTAADVYHRAGIYAEFGKIICVSVGLVVSRANGYGFRIKSFYGDDEQALLSNFAQMLEKFAAKEKAWLCAHNGREFDFPFIIRRMLVNRLAIPGLLDIADKKPWEVPFLDTMELWKFGAYKHYTSLNLLAHLFDIPTPKDDIDGSMVGSVYYQENDLDRIVQYCEKDALAVAQLFMRYKGEDLIDQNHIEYVRD